MTSCRTRGFQLSFLTGSSAYAWTAPTLGKEEVQRGNEICGVGSPLFNVTCINGRMNESSGPRAERARWTYLQTHQQLADLPWIFRMVVHVAINGQPRGRLIERVVVCRVERMCKSLTYPHARASTQLISHGAPYERKCSHLSSIATPVTRSSGAVNAIFVVRGRVWSRSSEIVSPRITHLRLFVVPDQSEP